MLLIQRNKKSVDGRHKAGHDDIEIASLKPTIGNRQLRHVPPHHRHGRPCAGHPRLVCLPAEARKPKKEKPHTSSSIITGT
jgi:hypothetical protein